MIFAINALLLSSNSVTRIQSPRDHTGAMSSYNPDKDIPDLSGKVILVTGGMSLGQILASRPRQPIECISS